MSVEEANQAFNELCDYWTSVQPVGRRSVPKVRKEIERVWLAARAQPNDWLGVQVLAALCLGRLGWQSNEGNRYFVWTAVKDLGVALGSPYREVLLDEVLKGAAAIQNAYVRSNLLTDILSGYSPSEQTRLALDVLQSAGKIRREPVRSQVLIRLVPWLPPLQALEVIAGMQMDTQRAWALNETLWRAAFVQSDLVTQHALIIAHCIEDDSSRAQCLAVVAEFLPPEEQRIVLQEALEIALALPENQRRLALPGVVRVFPTAEALELLLTQMNGFAADTLVDIALRLTPEQRGVWMPRIIELAYNLQEYPGVAYVFLRLMPVLTTEQALSIARNLTEAYVRNWILIQAAHRMEPAQCADVLAEALAAARAYPNAYGRAAQLAEIGALLLDETSDPVLSEALWSAMQEDEEFERSNLYDIISRWMRPAQFEMIYREGLWQESNSFLRQFALYWPEFCAQQKKTSSEMFYELLRSECMVGLEHVIFALADLAPALLKTASRVEMNQLMRAVPLVAHG